MCKNSLYKEKILNPSNIEADEYICIPSYIHIHINRLIQLLK